MHYTPMHYLKLITLLAALLSSPATARASEQATWLQDFDHQSVEDLGQLEQCDIADFDQDGDKEARFTASGRKAVFRLKLTRSGQLFKSVMNGDRSVFRFEVALPQGFEPNTPVQVQISVQTDAAKADGKDVFGRVVLQNKMNLVAKAPHQVAVDLLNVNLTTGESVSDLLTKFEAGAGKYFLITVVQVTKEGEVGSVVYDNFVMAAADKGI